MTDKGIIKLSEDELNNISGGDVRMGNVLNGFVVGLISPPILSLYIYGFLHDVKESAEHGMTAGFIVGRAINLSVLAAAYIALVRFDRKIRRFIKGK